MTCPLAEADEIGVEAEVGEQVCIDGGLSVNEIWVDGSGDVVVAEVADGDGGFERRGVEGGVWDGVALIIKAVGFGEGGRGFIGEEFAEEDEEHFGALVVVDRNFWAGGFRSWGWGEGGTEAAEFLPSGEEDGGGGAEVVGRGRDFRVVGGCGEGCGVRGEIGGECFGLRDDLGDQVAEFLFGRGG